MQNLIEITTYGLKDLFINSMIYSSIVIPFFLVFWVIWKSKFQHRRIQEVQKSTKAQRQYELKYSMISLFIFTLLDILLYITTKNHVTKLYTQVGDYGWWYFGVSIVVLILLHDAWFYFTHRLMHHPKLYKYVHKVHHQSVDPSPLAAFSFHPFEALLEGAFYVIYAFLIPVNLWAIITWQVIQMIFNVIGHAGYEIYPSGFNKHWLFKWKTPSTHHNMHHAHFSGNYGLYFTWWDKWLKTEFKDYHQKFEHVQKRIEEHNQIIELATKNAKTDHQQA